MRVLITGGSSGIGFSMGKYFCSMGYDVILVGRDKDKLLRVKKKLGDNVGVIDLDLSNYDNCMELYNKVRDVDVLVNNAGFGLFGEFLDTDMDKELEMIDINVRCLHILTKLYLKDMVDRDSGYILNVGSIAGFMPGPLMDTYYASKNYVVRLSEGIWEELRRRKSKVRISVLCPGPVKTNFDDVAGVEFSLKGMDSDMVGRYAVDMMFRGKFVIIPGLKIKMLRFLVRFVPDRVLVRFVYNSQRRKG